MTRLRSRISDRIVEAGSAPLLPGLFELDSEKRTPRLRAVQGGLPSEEKASFLGTFPEEQDTSAVHDVVGKMGEVDDFGLLAGALPFVRRAKEASGPLPLDEEITRHLKHL